MPDEIVVQKTTGCAARLRRIGHVIFNKENGTYLYRTPGSWGK